MLQEASTACSFNPSHSNIRMYILHTVLYTFTIILVKHRELLEAVVTSFIRKALMFDSAVVSWCIQKLNASHS